MPPANQAAEICTLFQKERRKSCPPRVIKASDSGIFMQLSPEELSGSMLKCNLLVVDATLIRMSYTDGQVKRILFLCFFKGEFKVCSYSELIGV